MPSPHEGLSVAAYPIPATLSGDVAGTEKKSPGPIFNIELIEKITLISLMSIIFAQILPGVQATNSQLAIGVSFVIILNTVLSHWLARSGKEWRSIQREFIVMSIANFGIVLIYVFFLMARYGGSVNLENTLFFILLLTLNVVLYDRYRPIYVRRQEEGSSGD
ncbi:MAG: hypothetical protein SCH66_10410 [Methanolobus sp.]|nr:hypothetical protein [Methanolobus sp.]